MNHDGSEEHAEHARTLSTFPQEWGPPEGRRDSPERASWVLRHATAEAIARPYRQLAAHDIRLINVLRRAHLLRCKHRP